MAITRWEPFQELERWEPLSREPMWALDQRANFKRIKCILSNFI